MRTNAGSSLKQGSCAAPGRSREAHDPPAEQLLDPIDHALGGVERHVVGQREVDLRRVRDPQSDADLTLARKLLDDLS